MHPRDAALCIEVGPHDGALGSLVTLDAVNDSLSPVDLAVGCNCEAHIAIQRYGIGISIALREWCSNLRLHPEWDRNARPCPRAATESPQRPDEQQQSARSSCDRFGPAIVRLAPHRLYFLFVCFAARCCLFVFFCV